MRFVSSKVVVLALASLLLASSSMAETGHAKNSAGRARIAPRTEKPALDALNDPCQALRAGPVSPGPQPIAYHSQPVMPPIDSPDSPVTGLVPSPTDSIAPRPSASPAPRQRGSLPSMICTAPGGYRVKYFGPESALSRVQVYRDNKLVSDYHCDESKVSCDRELSAYWLKFSASLLDYAKGAASGREKASTAGVQCHAANEKRAQ